MLICRSIGIEEDALFEMCLFMIRGESYQSKSHTFTTVIGVYLCVLKRLLVFISGGRRETLTDRWRVVIVLLQIKH